MIKNNKELIAEIKGAVTALTSTLTYLEKGDNAGKASASTGKKAKDSDEENETEGDGDRRAELEEMSYNALKALVSSLGGKAIGKKPDLIELILELEGEAENEDEDEVSKARAKKAGSKGKEDKEEESDEEVTEESMREQLADFEVSELKDIAKEMEVTVKAKATKGAIINVLVEDLEKLDETLEAMGYYAEEGSEDEEEDENEAGLANKLAEKDLEDLATICADNGISSKGKKQALVDRIVEAIESGDLEEADLGLDAEAEEKDSEDEEEGATVEDIVEELELTDLKAVAKELGLTVSKTAKAGALRKAILAEDEDSVVEALESLGLAGDKEDKEAEDDENDVEVSAKVTKAEDKIEADIRAKAKSGKLKDAVIKKFLSKYYEGDPDCKDCSDCSKEERLDCYVKVQRRFVDDDCEMHEESDPYTRGDVDFCCGKKLVAGKKKNTFVCEVCGEEYKFEE